MLVPGDFKTAFERFQRHQMSDHAAALTYYALLSLFPALLFAVAILGVFGEESLITDAARYLTEAGMPETTVDAVTGALESAVTSSGGTALTALLLGLGTSLYGASGAFGAAGRALNSVFRVDEGRGFVRRKLNDVAFTAVVLVLAIVTVGSLLLGGGLAADVLGLIGLGETAASVWNVARWPAALVSAMLVYAVVYYAAPNVRVERIKWISPGAVVGVLVWILASAAFFSYVANFGSYNKTYGAFAGAVILLVWLWLTNIALLFGAELNAAVDLRRSPELTEDYDGPPLPEKVPAEVG